VSGTSGCGTPGWNAAGCGTAVAAAGAALPPAVVATAGCGWIGALGCWVRAAGGGAARRAAVARGVCGRVAAS